MGVSRYYRSRDVIRLSGITYRQLDYWIRIGIIKSSGRNSAGKGNPRLFTFRDLVEVRTAKRLIDCGMKLQALRSALSFLRRYLSKWDHALSSERLITNGVDLFVLAENNESLLNINQCGQFVFSFGLKEEIEGLLKELGSDGNCHQKPSIAAGEVTSQCKSN